MSAAGVIDSLYSMLNDPESTVGKFFEKHKKKGTANLNSAGPNIAPEVYAALKNIFGEDVGGWRIYKNSNSQFTFTWTASDITKLKKGDTVEVTQRVYNLDTSSVLSEKTGSQTLSTNTVSNDKGESVTFNVLGGKIE